LIVLFDLNCQDWRPDYPQFSSRFNCCRWTTTLLRSSGGVGWFSCVKYYSL